MKYFVLHLQPEPWALGKVNRGGNGRRGGISPNLTLVSYQNAVKEELESQGASELPWPELCLEFYFWRRLDRYINMSDKIKQRNAADATNLGKGLEDALQGILFKNDRIVRDVHPVIMEQATETEPMIVIGARPFSQDQNMSKVLNSFPYEVMQKLDVKKNENEGNVWSDEDEELF